MPTASSGLLVSGLVLLVAAAVVEAMPFGLPSPGSDARPTPARDTSADPAAELAQAGLRGQVVFRDRACARWVLELPSDRARRVDARRVGARRACGRIERRVSPSGSFIAVPGRDGHVEVRARDGQVVTPADLSGDRLGHPRFRSVYAVTWSPDERWMAVATRRHVFFFRVGAGDGRVIRLPLTARELVWT